MAQLTYTFNGISQTTGNAMIAYLEKNSPTFVSEETAAKANGITNVVVNYGQGITDPADSGPDSSGVTPPTPGSSYLSAAGTWNINLNSLGVGALRDANGQPYILPAEVLVAHELGHATQPGISGPLTAQQVLQQESAVDTIQNGVTSDLNQNTGTNIPTNAAVGQQMIGNANPAIQAGAPIDPTQKENYSLATGGTLGAGASMTKVQPMSATPGNNFSGVTFEDDALISLQAGSQGTIFGYGNQVDDGSSCVIATYGNDDTLNLGAGSAATIVGADDAVDTSDGTITFGDGTSANVTGVGNMVDGGADNALIMNCSYTDATLGIDDTASFIGAHDDVNATSDTVNFGADSNGTVTGNYNTISGAVADTVNAIGNYEDITLGTGDTSNITGLHNDVSAESDTVNFGGNSSGTIDGDDNTISGAAGDTVNAIGNYEDMTLGTGDTSNITGLHDDVSASDDTVNFGNNTTGTITGSYDTIDGGTGDTVNAIGSYENMTLGTGDTADISGAHNDVDATSDTINFGNNTTGTITGSYDAIDGGTGDTVNASGSYENMTLGTGDTADITGAHNDVDATSDAVYFGNNTTGTITGDFNTIDGGKDDTITVDGNYENVTLDIGGTADITGAHDDVDASSNTIQFGNDTSGTVTGDSDTIAGTGVGESITVSGNGSVIYLSDATINVANSSGLTIVGSDDSIVAGSSDDVDLIGGGNSVSAGTGDTFNLNSTDGSSDSFNGNDDIVDIGSNSNIDANGYSDAITEAAGDSLGMYGGGDIVYAVDGASTTIGGTDGDFDAIVADGDQSGIVLNADSQAYVVGADNGVSESSGDSLYDYGGESAITTAEDTFTYINNIDEGYDTIYSNEDSIFGTTANGQDTGIDIDGESQAYIDGDNNDVYGSEEDVYFNGESDDYEGPSYDPGYDYIEYPYGSSGVAAGVVRSMNVVAQYDLAHGFTTAAAAANAAWNNTDQAIVASTSATGSVLSPFNGIRWAPGSVVTWSFAPPSSSGPDPVSGAIQGQYQAIIEQALQTWSAASGLTFEQVASSAPSDFQIGWGDFETGTSGLVGYTSYAGLSGGKAQSLLVRLEDPAEDSLVAGADGSLTYAGTQTTLYQSALHEIGHVLGISETSDPNSIMYPLLGPSNTGLDETDIDDLAALYGPAGTPGGDGSGYRSLSDRQSQLPGFYQSISSLIGRSTADLYAIPTSSMPGTQNTGAGAGSIHFDPSLFESGAMFDSMAVGGAAGQIPIGCRRWGYGYSKRSLPSCNRDRSRATRLVETLRYVGSRAASFGGAAAFARKDSRRTHPVTLDGCRYQSRAFAHCFGI